jgi:hypothetical protein
MDRAQSTRAWRVPFWRGTLVTVLLCLALSVELLFDVELYAEWDVSDILLGWLLDFRDRVVVGAAMFFPTYAASLIRVPGALTRALLLGATLIFGAAGGELALRWPNLPAPEDPDMKVFLLEVLRWTTVGGLALGAFTYLKHADAQGARLHASKLARAQAERQMLEARLQLLRAQIEPHFLFNTLATVRRLYRTDRPEGRQMFASFLAYLHTSMPQIRAGRTTLGQEVELARAYLQVLQVRMGKRLHVVIEVPAELQGLDFPSLTLATLVENAIKHGLSPLPEGGEIHIGARLEAPFLFVTVADTGAGLHGEGGAGTGLANLRMRLSALYGPQARVSLEANSPRGIRATIRLPAPVVT